MLCLKHALSVFLCTFEVEKKELETDWQTYVCMFLAGKGMSWCLSDVADRAAILLMEGWGKALAFSRNGATEGLQACETASQPPWLRQSGLSLTVSCSQPSLPQNPIASSLENSPASTLSSPFLLLFWSRVLFTSWPNNCNGLCSGLHFTSCSLFQFVLNTYFQAKAPETWLTLLLPGLQWLSVACSIEPTILCLTFKVPPGEEVSLLLKIKVQNPGCRSWFCQILALGLREGCLSPLESQLRHL